MPIYAYKCGACGHAADVMQKIADAPLTQCPACGAAAFAKQLTAPGFALKGSGWYATDFKGGAKPPADSGTAASDGGGKADAKTETKSDAKSDSKPAAAHTCSSGCTH